MARSAIGPNRLPVWTRRSGGNNQRAQWTTELRPSAAVVELPGLGHYPQVEAPKAYAEAALSLLVD